MQPFRYHVFICNQQKPDGIPCCAARNSEALIAAMRAEVNARGLEDEVQITPCGSLGLCERGPNMVVYPDGVWYSAVSPEDVAEIVRVHFAEGSVVERLANTDEASVRAEILRNRARMQAAMRAKEAAGTLPDEVFQKIRGFQESRVMLTAVELDAFTAVGEGATAEEAAVRMKTDARATAMLLHALVAIGMLQKRGETFFNTPLTNRYFREGSPNDSRASMMHSVNMWNRWSTLTDCVRTGTAVGLEQGQHGPDWAEAFIAAMHKSGMERGALVAHAIGAQQVKRMLDIGGGSGAYSIALAQANPNLQAEILDVPAVLPIMQRHIDAAGLADRIRTRAGDLRTDDFGEGYDLILISSICHMLSEAENQDLLNRAVQALAPGGRLVIQEFLLDPTRTGPRFAALFSINMLVATRSGASYTEEEYAAWMRQAGLKEVHCTPLPGPSDLIMGTKAS